MANFDREQVVSVVGSLDKVVMGRLTKDVDLFEGIKEVCKRHDIQTATFQCIGSFSSVYFVQAGLNDKGELSYTEPTRLNKAVELLSGTGFVGLDVNGELDIHFHGLFVDTDGNISGGHFLQGGNPTAVTIEYTLQPTRDIHMQRKIDPTWNLPVFQFSKRG